MPWGYHRRRPQSVPKPFFDRVRWYQRAIVFVVVGALGLFGVSFIFDLRIVTPLLNLIMQGTLFILWFVWPRIEFRRMSRELEGQKYELCLGCAYPLKGLPANHRCPECGREFRLEDVQAAWMYWTTHGRLPRAAYDDPNDPD